MTLRPGPQLRASCPRTDRSSRLTSRAATGVTNQLGTTLAGRAAFDVENYVGARGLGIGQSLVELTAGEVPS